MYVVYIWFRNRLEEGAYDGDFGGSGFEFFVFVFEGVGRVM